MKTPLLLLIALLVAIGIIYRAGNLIPAATPRRATAATVQHAPAAQLPVPDAVLTADQARQLTSEQRLERLRKAAAIIDEDEQADSLIPLIEALTKDELPAASTVFREIRMIRGSISESNWDALSIQWGRLDPLGYLKFLTDVYLGQDIPYTRMVMKGWLETDPTAALAWAQSPKESSYEVEMATVAIIDSAEGDPQQLATALLALPAGDITIHLCLDTYFDLVAATTGNPDPSVIYENLPPALRIDAWFITMKRLAEADHQAAVDWLTAHVNDPGCNYYSTVDLVSGLADEDPAGTAQWAATFPNDINRNQRLHPAMIATSKWFEKDPVAANAWYQTLPDTLPWIIASLRKIQGGKDSNAPAPEAVEN